MSKTGKSELTVLVFKDNSSARTFKVPTRWISRLGLTAGVTAAVACLGVFLSLKYYLVARQAVRIADPSYVQDLETEVATLRASTKASSPSGSSAASAQGAVNPAPTVTVTMAPSQNGPSVSLSSNPGFMVVPPSTTVMPANEVPIDIYDPHVSWVGRTFRAQFFIHYARDDKGNQQGRIVLLAHGPDTILAYPAGVLNNEPSQPLVAPEKGEYFSVSRIREVKADFGPMKSRTALKNVEIFLFSPDGRLLIHKILTPQAEDSGDEGAGTTSR